MIKCDTCRCRKVCDRDEYGFENCDSYIPEEEIVLTNEEKLEAFLDELSALTRKHGLKIWGCGCCGSPCIQTMDGKTLHECLYFDEEKGEYDRD